ncbi:pullulanase-specific type II secretion system outer membrane lipoprotein [Klebsiella michiganensis]|nr:pullulanase-specific type II secretion system outer membrane lipoprotein [Klebsiella michiganensis]
MRNFILFPLMAVALLSGCQQNRSTTLSPAVSGQAQLEQLASVAAGARYLKNKCNRSDLPADEAINRAAINVGKKRGWANIDDNLLSQRSTQLYQQLQQDSTRKPQNAASLIASWRHLLIACAAINSAYFYSARTIYSACGLSSIAPPGQSSSAARVNVLPLKLNTVRSC